MTERVLSFRGWQEGEQSEHIERKVRMLISKWKASYHLEKKIRLSFQNDKIISSKWQLCPSFQNDSFAKINLLLIYKKSMTVICKWVSYYHRKEKIISIINRHSYKNYSNKSRWSVPKGADRLSFLEMKQ